MSLRQSGANDIYIYYHRLYISITVRAHLINVGNNDRTELNDAL